MRAEALPVSFIDIFLTLRTMPGTQILVERLDDLDQGGKSSVL